MGDVKPRLYNNRLCKKKKKKKKTLPHAIYEQLKAQTSRYSLKKDKRKVQGVPQSQTAALHRLQEEEETEKTKQAQIEQTYEKH